MLKIDLHFCLCLLLIFSCFRNGATGSNNPYDNKQQHHLLRTTNTAANDGYNAQQSAFNANTVQGNSNYQQLYRYYYTPPQPAVQLWSGPPIVVADDIQQRQQQQQRHLSTNIPPTFYQQHSTGSIESSSESLPFVPRHARVLTPAAYNLQPTTARTTQTYLANTNSNNNNNIIYHRDFRHDIYARPESEHTRQQDSNIVSWNNQQLLEQQQQQQFYSSDTNLNYNGIYNDLLAASLRKVHVPDYREHFKRYLENNPRRIEPIY